MFAKVMKAYLTNEQQVKQFFYYTEDAMVFEIPQ
jgi:hypothetical protein